MTLFKNRQEYLSYVRNFIFGVEDSLVSTVGLISGIAAAGASKNAIILSGIVLIFVEAFSMGVGSYLSEHSTSDHDSEDFSHRTPIVGGAIMLVSYIIAGFVPLLPYMLTERDQAFSLSIVASLIGLLGLGFLSSILVGKKSFRPAINMLVLGGLAIAIGIIAGKLVGHY